MRAILSVYDKTGVVSFGKKLSESGVNIISTGGTYKQLSDSKIEVTSVKEVTGFPEILDGVIRQIGFDLEVADAYAGFQRSAPIIPPSSRA